MARWHARVEGEDERVANAHDGADGVTNALQLVDGVQLRRERGDDAREACVARRLHDGVEERRVVSEPRHLDVVGPAITPARLLQQTLDARLYLDELVARDAAQ
jgi:hypothetical protein